MFTKIKIYAILGVLSLLGVSSCLNIIQFRNNKDTIEVMKKDNEILSLQISKQNEVIIEIKDNYDKIMKITAKYSTIVNENARNISKLNASLNREKVDTNKKSLAELSEVKPKLVSKVINEAIKSKFTDIEKLTNED